MFLYTPVNLSSRSTSAPCVHSHVTLIFHWKGCGKSAHVCPQGFERPCRKAIFTRSIFCRSLSGTAGPLRYRKHLIDLVWKCSTNLPNHRSDSCAKSDTRFCPWHFSVGFCCLNGVALIQVSFGVLWTGSQVSLTYFTTYFW